MTAATANLHELLDDAGRARKKKRVNVELPGVLTLVLDPLRIILVTLTIFNISRVHLAFPILAKARPGLVLVVAAAGWAFLNAKSITKANLMQFWPMRRIVMLTIVAVASIAFGISLGKSAMFFLNSYFKTVLYCFLIALSIRNVRDLYTFVWSLAISSGILAFLALFVFKLTSSNFTKVSRLNNFYTYDSNDVCVVFLVGLAAVLLLLNVARGWQKMGLFLIVVSIGAAVARSGSRGGFLGLLAFGLAALFLINSVAFSKRMLLLASVAGGMIIFSPPGYLEQMKTILETKKDYNTRTANGRSALIKRGLHYINEYPIFGLGLAAFSTAECDYRLSRIHTGADGTRCGAPHNSYIEATSETGLVGGAIWMSLVLGGIYSMLKLRRRLPRSWSRGNRTERFLYASTTYFAIALVGFAVSSFFVSFAWQDVLYLQVALMSGLYLSIAVYRSQPVRQSQSPVQNRRMPGWRVQQSARRALPAPPQLRRLQAPR